MAAKREDRYYCGKYPRHTYVNDVCARCGSRRLIKGEPAPGAPIVPAPAAPEPERVSAREPAPGAPPPPAAPPPPPPVDPGAALRAAVPPQAPPPRDTTEEDKKRAEEREAKRLRLDRFHKFVGRRIFSVIDAVTDRAVVWASKGKRKPAECDEDEEEMITEGLTEVSKDLFGEVELTPWGKVALGTTVMTVGKWTSAEQVALPPAPPKPPAPDRQG